MSLHTKLDTHQRQLKALLEEHTALVESRLASIDARLGGQPAEEVDAYKSEIARLEGEKQELAEKNYSLRATLEAVNYETGSEISKLKSELDAARSQQRYHGCYNVSGRKSHVRDVAAHLRDFGRPLPPGRAARLPSRQHVPLA
jgi:chromosome segregation ATPase